MSLTQKKSGGGDEASLIATVTANTGASPAPGAVPLFDGTKFVWSAIVSSGIGGLVVGSTFIVG